MLTMLVKHWNHAVYFSFRLPFSGDSSFAVVNINIEEIQNALSNTHCTLTVKTKLCI